MSVTCGFYNSINKDRKYNATHFSKIFDGIIKDGVFMSIGDKLIVSAGKGMTIKVGTGKAWFNHTWTENDSLLPLIVPPSDVVYNRIDAVVLEVNSNLNVRKNTIKLLKGQPGTSPEAPALTKSDTMNQYYLCKINVSPNTEEILQENITNMVGTEDTPFVSGILETVNAEELMKQWDEAYKRFIVTGQDEFTKWFNNIKDQLSEDAAGRLQMQIGNLKNLITDNQDDLVSAINEIRATAGKWIGGATILKTELGSSKKIANDEIHSDSIVTVVFSEESKQLINGSDVTYTTEEGVLTISTKAISSEQDIIISNIKVVNPSKISTKAKIGEIREAETLNMDCKIAGNVTVEEVE